MSRGLQRVSSSSRHAAVAASTVAAGRPTCGVGVGRTIAWRCGVAGAAVGRCPNGDAACGYARCRDRRRGREVRRRASLRAAAWARPARAFAGSGTEAASSGSARAVSAPARDSACGAGGRAAAVSDQLDELNHDAAGGGTARLDSSATHERDGDCRSDRQTGEQATSASVSPNSSGRHSQLGRVPASMTAR